MKKGFLVAALLAIAADCQATPFWLVNVGSGGKVDRGSIGVEAGGTQALWNSIPLSGEISVAFTDQTEPNNLLDNNQIPATPYSVRRYNYGPEFGFMAKSGVNLDRVVRNLTLQLGAGYALQTVEEIATSTVTGAQWRSGDTYVRIFPDGYGGLLYRINRINLSAGYDYRRGVVAGIGWRW